MRVLNLPIPSRLFLFTAGCVLVAGSICTYIARADDSAASVNSKFQEMTKMAQSKLADANSGIAPAAPDDAKSAIDRLSKMQEVAADPAKVDGLERDMARLLVMDRMASNIAQDQQVKVAMIKALADPKVKKARDDAAKMAKDPATLKKIEDEISADPVAMNHIDHMAINSVMRSNREPKAAKGS